MYVVKSDHPDVTATLSVEARDSEGHKVPLPSGLRVEATSDNESAVSVAQSEDDPFKFSVHFGTVPEDVDVTQANLIFNLFDANDALIGTADASFTVTVGDVASIAIGSLSFEGLTPQEGGNG